MRRYAAAAMAERVGRAVAVDDPGFVTARQKGTRLTLTLTGDSAGSLRRSADDLLAALQTAEATLAVTRSARARSRATPRRK